MHFLHFAGTQTSSPTTQTLQKLPMNKKVKKEELNNELMNHVMHTAKTALFCTCKFIEDEEEEKEVTDELIEYLPVDLGMPKEEFTAKYSNVVYEGIKAGRTDVQSSGKKRAQGTHDLCKFGSVLGNYK